jgi:predicted phage replisome organizer
MLPNKTSQKKFFWLKLHHDFFNRDEIRIIESQPNGKDYIIFYLKLMLKSINDNGKLLFKDTIPYTPEMLASITNTSIDTVRVAIDAFAKLGLITLLDDGALFMQEVQKLVGSETPDAERKRIARAKQNTPLKLPRQDKKRTLSGHLSEKVTLENRDKSLDNRNNNPSYIPQSNASTNDSGIVEVWLSHAESRGYNFTEEEINPLSEFAKSMSEVHSSISSEQIFFNLDQIFDAKQKNFDIKLMMLTSAHAKHKVILKPNKNYLLVGANLASAKTGRYPATEYITPENKSQKNDLRNYLERCYMREMVDPRTGAALTNSQKQLFKLHFAEAKAKRISITEYIYRHEVLTGVSLLDQPLDSADTSTKPVAA